MENAEVKVNGWIPPTPEEDNVVLLGPLLSVVTFLLSPDLSSLPRRQNKTNFASRTLYVFGRSSKTHPYGSKVENRKMNTDAGYKLYMQDLNV